MTPDPFTTPRRPVTPFVFLVLSLFGSMGCDNNVYYTYQNGTAQPISIQADEGDNGIREFTNVQPAGKGTDNGLPSDASGIHFSGDPARTSFTLGLTAPDNFTFPNSIALHYGDAIFVKLTLTGSLYGTHTWTANVWLVTGSQGGKANNKTVNKQAGDGTPPYATWTYTLDGG